MSIIKKINVNNVSYDIKTSSDIEVQNDDSTAELNIGDINGNVIAQFKDGHIKTKNFNSNTINSSQTNPSPSPLEGKIVAFLGDSITQGVGASQTTRYSTVFSNLSGCIELNLGVAGDTIGYKGMNMGGFITRAEQTKDADFIFVFGGTNDFSYNPNPIGPHFAYESITPDQYVGSTKKVPPSDTTFSGALHSLIIKLREVSPDAQIVFITPMNRCRFIEGRPASSEANANGDYLQDYIHCIDDICEFYAIPVIHIGQMLNFDWTYDKDAGHVMNKFDNDGIHPNVLGHERIAKLLYKWVQSNIII